MTYYPKRLIEVDLPIARISAHARREKSIRHGHISTLHIWWARRPLAACRAVICAALWPDPADENCPQAFRDAASRHIMGFAIRADGDLKLLATSSEEGKARWAALVKTPISPSPTDEAELLTLRAALLDFIADFANWDNSTSQPYLETSRALTQAAHEALGGEPGTRPLVVDPFAGGGAIPLEALRVGADAFASDLNPVAVLLNKVLVEYIPKFGERLADKVCKWGAYVQDKARSKLAAFYSPGPDGATPITYFWARTCTCEGPKCGAKIPLLRATALTKNAPIAHVTVYSPRKGKVEIRLSDGPEPHSTATVRQGSVTCPACGYTTPARNVKKQMADCDGGANSAILYAVLTERNGTRAFRPPHRRDLECIRLAMKAACQLEQTAPGCFPDEEINPLRPYKNTVGVSVITSIGMRRFKDLYTYRQLVSLLAFQEAIDSLPAASGDDNGVMEAVRLLLHFAVDRLVAQNSSLSRWDSSRSTIKTMFSKQALQVLWDFAESNPLGDGTGNWKGAIEWVEKVIRANTSAQGMGTANRAAAALCPLPDDSCHLFFTDPPYFAAIPYADLSDVFYVWLRRGLRGSFETLFSSGLVEKEEELVVSNSAKGPHGAKKDPSFFCSGMTQALVRAREIAKPDAIGCVVFADSSTASWEALLSAIVAGGWCLHASWPLDTEMQNRTRAQGSASLQSSIFMVCRPRETPEGAIKDDVGEWRDALTELPKRIHEWMPRLAREGVVGADAIFACLGPALEVFSRYSRVEKASGEEATLREYLEHVWAAVSTEALSMIFDDADAAGLEPDARLTAMWLWTLGGGSGKAGANGNGHAAERDEAEGEAEDDAFDEEGEKEAKATGYVLEFDAARKIAQGLGIHLEKSESIVEVKGDKARLLSVADRTQHLFGKDTETGATGRGKKKAKQRQKTLFEELDNAQATEAGWGKLKGPPPGTTVLDRLHQAMILFAAGRGELLKRFLVEDGVGTDSRFWKLAQSLSALYPRGRDEKRWVDGVLARKKGLGL